MLILVVAAVIGLSPGTNDQAIPKPDPASKIQQSAPPVPPISVTVVGPPQSEEEKHTEADERRRDVNAQETMASFTKALFVLGVLQFFAAVAAVYAAVRAAKAADAADKHFRTVERACPTLEAAEPVTFWPNGLVDIVMRIRNHGPTSATISDVVVKAFVLRPTEHLPERPDYSRPSLGPQEPRAAFVEGGNKADVAIVDLPVENPANKPYSIGKGSPHRLYLIGYVDYIDTFGERRRSGWARAHNPEIDDQSLAQFNPLGVFDHELYDKRNNLKFLNAPGYNYDMARSADE